MLQESAFNISASCDLDNNVRISLGVDMFLAKCKWLDSFS
jgi:hypothetical protein